jgi:hypothetical protein
MLGDLSKLGLTVTQHDGILVLTFDHTKSARTIGELLADMPDGARHLAIGMDEHTEEDLRKSIQAARKSLSLKDPVIEK